MKKPLNECEPIITTTLKNNVNEQHTFRHLNETIKAPTEAPLNPTEVTRLWFDKYSLQTEALYLYSSYPSWIQYISNQWTSFTAENRVQGYFLDYAE